jgi:nucleoside-diphosphate-sugar epimerase
MDRRYPQPLIFSIPPTVFCMVALRFLMSAASLLPKKILVTGVAGFIGSRVCALLHEQGCELTGIDIFNDAYDVRLKDWRWAQLEPLRGLELHRMDLGDKDGLRKLFAAHASRRAGARPFDAVANLAARAGVRASVENPSVYVETNITGGLNLLELCRNFGVKKFVLASTSSLYGQGLPTPYREDLNTDHPLSPYAATKKAAEAMAYTYHYLHGIDVSALRYFTVYGPAGRPDMAPLRFVQRIREGRTITVFGDGSQSRDFTYVDDIARGTIASLRPVGYEAFNLGSDEPLQLSAMIRLIEELTGQKTRIDYRPGHPADVPTTWADISKAGKLLDWKPQTSFRKGMQNLVSWYEENRSWAAKINTD